MNNTVTTIYKQFNTHTEMMKALRCQRLNTIHTHTLTHTHTYTHTHTHKHTYTRAHARTHAHTVTTLL
jgi:hypothetical protein